ncbi:MAG: tripartite tricarboxylate transporter TctB family protein [Chloroflexi bacterium]|nr:tripartite tricarboxylate transporter TctB family protein [Chloroflexota bacterium]
MDRKADALFLIGLLLVMLAIVATSWRESSLEAKLLPIVLGSLVFVLAALELAGVLRRVRARGAGVVVNQDATATVESTEVGETPGGYLKESGWVVAFFVGVYVLGFAVSTPILVFTYMRTHGGSWLQSATYAIGTGIFVWGLFDFLLKLNLYRGEIFTWLGS